jgi:microcompartment protein CcmL/EutN
MPLLRAPAQAIQIQDPAIGLIEVTSLSRGVVVADAMVKRAPVRLVLVRPVSPGKHLTLCTGEVAEVQEAMAAGLAVAGSTLCDQLLLTQVHEEVVRVLSGAAGPGAVALLPDAALGLFETFSAAAALLAADSACKAAEVRIVLMRLCDGLGGKGFFALRGELDMVQAALLAGQRATVPGLFHSCELIARPHEDLLLAL